MKRFILVIIMMISTLGIYSFTSNALDAKKQVMHRTTTINLTVEKLLAEKSLITQSLLAANRTLPFGTNVKVTNLRNGKEVIVRINDRGPYHSSRSLDMSKAAFDEIGDINRGTIPVEYEIVD